MRPSTGPPPTAVVAHARKPVAPGAAGSTGAGGARRQSSLAPAARSSFRAQASFAELRRQTLAGTSTRCARPTSPDACSARAKRAPAQPRSALSEVVRCRVSDEGRWTLARRRAEVSVGSDADHAFAICGATIRLVNATELRARCLAQVGAIEDFPVRPGALGVQGGGEDVRAEHA